MFAASFVFSGQPPKENNSPPVVRLTWANVRTASETEHQRRIGEAEAASKASKEEAERSYKKLAPDLGSTMNGCTSTAAVIKNPNLARFYYFEDKVPTSDSIAVTPKTSLLSCEDSTPQRPAAPSRAVEASMSAEDLKRAEENIRRAKMQDEQFDKKFNRAAAAKKQADAAEQAKAKNRGEPFQAPKVGQPPTGRPARPSYEPPSIPSAPSAAVSTPSLRPGRSSAH